MISLSDTIKYPWTMLYINKKNMIHSILTLATRGTMINPRYFDNLAFFTGFGLSEHFNGLLDLLDEHILV